MRKTILFATAAMMFAAVSVQADIVERTEPVPASYGGFTSIAIGDTNAGGENVAEEAYLYLPGSNRFFTQGNDYGTHASVARTGLKVRVNKFMNANLGEEEWDGESYIIEDSVATQGAWKKWWFVENGIGMYVDYNDQADFVFEVETEANSQTFRLHGGEKNPNVNMTTFPGQYVGWAAGNPDDTHILANLTADVTTNDINWAFVKADVYAAFEAQVATYEASIPLLAAIKEAKELGINTDEWDAIYNNPEATVEQLNAATDAVNLAIQEYGKNNASVENPADMTSLIVNPSYDNNDNTGWSGTAPAFGFTAAEHFNKDFDTYQDIKDAPNGVYMLSLSAFYRAGDAQPALNLWLSKGEGNRNFKLYAKVGDDEVTSPVMTIFDDYDPDNILSTGNTATPSSDGVTYTITNNMEGAEAYFQAGRYADNKVFFAVPEGKMRIGIKKEANIGNNWCIWDNWKLTYYGNAADAYKFWAEKLKESYPDYSDLGESIVTTSYIEAFNEALGVFDTAEDYESIMAAIPVVAAAEDSLKANIQAWAEFVAKVEEANEVAADDQYADSDEKGELSDYAMDAEDIINDAKANGGELTTQELRDRIAYMNQLIKKVKEGLKEDGDATSLVVNPNFEQGATGWTRVAANGGNVATGGTSTNTCYEAWNNSNFDVYQVVEGAPAGIYEIEVQGFYRKGRGDNAYSIYMEAEQGGSPIEVPAFVYMNDMKTPLVNVFAEPKEDESFYTGTTYYSANDGAGPFFPDAMNSSAVAFNAGMYKSSAYGLVGDGEPMRIGVKGSTNQLNDSWAIWDNFKLTFRGKNPIAVKAVIDFILPQAWADLDGDIYCNADVQTALENAIEEATIQSAQASLDTKEELYEALMNLVKARTALADSKAAYATLKPALTELEAALAAYGATASEEAGANAATLFEQAQSGYENGTYLDSEIPAVIQSINEAIAALKINGDMYDATDENPYDCTDLIVNPSYDENDNTGWSGDAPGFQTYTNAEMFNKNFNYYQDLSALPEGTYEVKVWGFYRHGSAAEDYRLFTANPNEGNNFFLFAETYEGEDTVKYSAPMERLAKYAEPYTKEGGLKSEWAAAKEATDTEDGYQVPNMMSTAEAAFQEGYYQDNSLIVKVGADGKLRIGLKKAINHDNDWCIWDGWTLTYYGKESTKAASDDVATAITSLEGATTVSRQVYNVNGVRTNGLKKGVNIVRETLSDGTVRIMKITIR